MTLLLLALLACDVPEAEGQGDPVRGAPFTRTDGGTWWVGWFPFPEPLLLGHPNTLYLHVARVADGVPERDVDLDLAVRHLPTGDLLDPPAEVTRAASGRPRAEPVTFDRAGRWRLTVTVIEGARREEAVFDTFCCAFD